MNRKKLLTGVFCVTCLLINAQWSWLNPLPQGHNILDAWFFSQDSGIMVGSGGTIMNTHDGGNSWSIQSISNYEESCYLYDLSFADRNCGFLIEVWKNVWKTSDGGSTWVR